MCAQVGVAFINNQHRESMLACVRDDGIPWQPLSRLEGRSTVQQLTEVSICWALLHRQCDNTHLLSHNQLWPAIRHPYDEHMGR